jgi:hypothetical protein
MGSLKQDEMPPGKGSTEEEKKTNSSLENTTEMYSETFYDADNIFFEENKALKDDQKKIQTARKASGVRKDSDGF